jgi:tRNA G37 N-methylase Trm5
MFSRGNISEKIRFGRLVQKGERVLDLYAGIGYFTLPALINGQAEHVYACEWNPDAIQALRYNLQDNGVDDRATVLEGDCRAIAREHGLVDMFDRVSLGLIPSSEGGWLTAVRALKVTGGWLHVHGNVPAKEVEVWSRWLCLRLRDYAVRDDDLVVLLTHVEKVKSFAPTVNHYVADVFLGPADCILRWKGVEMASGTAGVLLHDGTVDLCPDSIDPPSCALSDDGVLHQAWMREEDAS